MTEFSKKTSIDFWTSQSVYPKYGDFIKKRRLTEINFLTSWIWDNDIKTLNDIGCGDGANTIILQELTNIKVFNCYDISEQMLSSIDIRGKRSGRIFTNVIDLCETKTLSKADLSIIMGVNMYLCDNDVLNLLSNINSKAIILRDPCAKNHTEINTYSKKLNMNYSGIYRTINEYCTLYERAGWIITDVFRAFSDEIESEFDTKQNYFILKKN